MEHPEVDVQEMMLQEKLKNEPDPIADLLRVATQ